MPLYLVTDARLHGDFLAQPCLDTALRDGIAAHRLTLITAPAGSGKTTLLAALVAPLAAAPQFSCAWRSLDEDDDHPARFLAALLYALRGLHPTRQHPPWRCLRVLTIQTATCGV